MARAKSNSTSTSKTSRNGKRCEASNDTASRRSRSTTKNCN